MLSKDQSIIMQVAAKEASNLVVKSENLEATLTDWEVAFNFVNEKLQAAYNAESAVDTIKQAFPEATVVDAPTTSPNSVVMSEKIQVSTVRVVGEQHGDLPKWIIDKCRALGIQKIWDNRNTAAGTKRPWFKQADAPEGAEPAAFWPPKGQA
jgi:predicted dinucleotide-binding enzyme